MKKILFVFAIGAIVLGMASCGEGNDPVSSVNPVNPLSDRGLMPGKFSVGDDVQIQFSQGNLQFQASAGIWRFAEHQWDFVGDADYGTVFNGEEKSNNAKISSSYSGWIDLFGWSTSGYADKNPWMVSTDALIFLGNGKSHITGTKFDWGVYNPISNGGNSPGLWRTIDTNELQYLFSERKNSANLAGYATVHGVGGLILLPDGFVMPDGMPFKPYKSGNKFSDVTYTDEQWQQLEALGAVFLPAAGNRSGVSVKLVGEEGAYWSSSYISTSNQGTALLLTFKDKDELKSYSYRYANNGLSVRLVRTVGQQSTIPSQEVVPAPEGAIDAIFTLSNGKRAYFSKGNLQYQPSTKQWRFAEHQWDYIGGDNQYIDGSFTGWIDLFGWGTGNTPALSSTNDADYSEFTEWGNKIDNSGRWRTLTRQDFNALLGTHYGFGRVCGVNGIIYLPDNWQDIEGLPKFEYGLHAGAGMKIVDEGLNNPNENNYNSSNQYDESQWEKMEKQGAVFLPAAGYREGKSVKKVKDEGRYWTSTEMEENKPYELYFTSHLFGYNSKNNRHFGQSVRLIYVIDK